MTNLEIIKQKNLKNGDIITIIETSWNGLYQWIYQAQLAVDEYCVEGEYYFEAIDKETAKTDFGAIHDPNIKIKL
jgi:hypothetical protein